MADEKCQRCGCDGEGDLRTIWMSCFYAMEELNLPFEKRILLNAKVEDLTSEKEGVKVDLGNGKKLNLTAGTVKCSGEMFPIQFYVLRVCKECRAKWMEFQKIWWAFKGTDKPEETGTGVFIRENGATRELSIEEVVKFRNNKGVEPARVKTPEYQKMLDKIHRLNDTKLVILHDELTKHVPTDECHPGISVDDCLQEVIKEMKSRELVFK